MSFELMPNQAASFECQPAGPAISFGQGFSRVGYIELVALEATFGAAPDLEVPPRHEWDAR